MTEVPEYLLQRSRERRAALGLAPAEGDAGGKLKAGMPVKITGFTANQIRAFDVANSNQPVEIEGSIEQDNNTYSISIGRH